MFYLAISILVAVIFCYIIFIVKINMQRSQIADLDLKMATVGTDQQKEQEKKVLAYQKKLNDFTYLFKSYGFASNVFAFMEKETLPNVWFKRFDLNARNNEASLSGEADDMSVFSRQLAGFEKNKYVKKVNLLSSNLEESTKVEFTLSLTLDPSIFDYVLTNNPANPAEQANPATPTGQLIQPTIQ